MNDAQKAALEALTGKPLMQAQIDAIDPLLPDRRDDIIAGILGSHAPVRNSKFIGNGTILSVLGFVKGTQVLDIFQAADYRYVRPLLEQGRLDIADPEVVEGLQPLVTAGIITQAQKDALVNKGYDFHPITPLEVSVALNNAEGA